MPRYKATFRFTITGTHEFDADGPEEAEDEAWTYEYDEIQVGTQELDQVRVEELDTEEDA